MTIEHFADGRTMHRHKYKCDVCGKVDFWDGSWSRFTSINLDETCPGDVPSACSPECAEEMNRKIDSGEWGLPRLANKGYYCEVIKERRGY
ncbi:MAG: hypothetical protein ABNH42_04315 [Marinobacter sp.]|jgi:hypothetical protein